MAKPMQDPVVARLDKLISVLQDLVVIEGYRAGLKSRAVRSVLGIDRRRLASTWKHLSSSKDGPTGD